MTNVPPAIPGPGPRAVESPHPSTQHRAAALSALNSDLRDELGGLSTFRQVDRPTPDKINN